jgi:hypothetical protein
MFFVDESSVLDSQQRENTKLGGRRLMPHQKKVQNAVAKSLFLLNFLGHFSLDRPFSAQINFRISKKRFAYCLFGRLSA